jgi:hypothetical protein
MARVRYRGAGGSGVEWFETGADFIRVWFVGGDGYEYDGRHPGKRHVDEMKRCAFAGRGLASYISRNINDNYARKL